MSDIDDKDRPRDRDRRRDRSRLEGGRDNRDRSNDRGREPRSMKSSQNRVFVSNIPYEYRWQDIKDLFRNQVGDVQFVELFTDDNDKPKGSGIVEFSDAASVKKCMELMQRYEVKGRKLVIKEDTGTIRDRHGAVVGGKRGRDSDRYRDDHRDNIGGNLSIRNDEGKWGNTYGLSPHFLESLNIDAPLCNKVFVANLPYDVEKKKLKDVFRLAGRVVRVDMPLDKDGRSRGFSVIEFDHPVEAVQAISMFHNQVYMDRTMTVRMDRASETFKLPEGLKSIGMGLGPNGEPLKNVALNLPSSGGNSNQNSSILGAVPNNSLQLANALSGLGNVSALGTLANTQALQAANLSGLLGNGLGGADLSSLVQNPLASQTAATQQQLAALAAQNTSNLSSANGLGYNRGGGGESTFQSPSSYNTGNLGSNSNRFQGNSQAFGGGSSGNYGNDRTPFSGSGGGSMMRPSLEGKSFSRKVLVSNLPPTASYKMLHEKFTEFGDVHAFEEKNHGSVLITYGSDWQAERAIKNLDKARIDGRMIDARLFF